MVELSAAEGAAFRAGTVGVDTAVIVPEWDDVVANVSSGGNYHTSSKSGGVPFSDDSLKGRINAGNKDMAFTEDAQRGPSDPR